MSAFANQLDLDLEKYRQGAGYVDYSTVAQPQRRALADAVNALAEPLSQVAAKVL
jgi:iron uptake system component EfeO